MNGSSAASGIVEKTPRERSRRIGRDELNLADWRISVPTHQQPRKADGGKLDVIEYTIPRQGGGDQRVTLMAPSVVGLPTPADEDLLLALLCLAKEQAFESDTVRFSTTELCEAMHRSVNQATRDRIEEGLTRLRALTIKYELAWYDKVKAEVEPVLITGIVSEAKLMRRRGRPRRDEPSDSYVQWTKNFFNSIRSGNLTDIDLDLYFSISRPGARQLYRHLNKRFHGRREGERYERDLRQLACGHLGMKHSKFLKRNLDLCIRELEEQGYIVPEEGSRRYRSVRPGVWRVGFALAPEHQKGSRRSRGSETAAAPVAGEDPAARLVRSFHRLWSGAGECRVTHGEAAIARRLLEVHPAEVLEAALPQAVKVLRLRWPDCRTFKGVETYLDEALRPVREQRKRAESAQREQAAAAREQGDREHSKKREAELLRRWESLSQSEQQAVQDAAFRGHPAHILARHPKIARSLLFAELSRGEPRGSEDAQ